MLGTRPDEFRFPAREAQPYPSRNEVSLAAVYPTAGVPYVRERLCEDYRRRRHPNSGGHKLKQLEGVTLRRCCARPLAKVS
jgi:hypothetical protein